MKKHLLVFRVGLLLLCLVGFNSLWSQTVYVNTTFGDWTPIAAKVNTPSTQNVVCGDGITRTFTLNMSTVTTNALVIGRLGSSSGPGWVELPAFPSIGKITIGCTKTTKDYTIQESTDGGSTWTTVESINPNNVAGTYPFSYQSSTPKKLRLVTVNTSGDITITSLRIESRPKDLVPPVYVSSLSDPTDQETGISPNIITDLSVAFDKPITKGSGNIIISDGATQKSVLISNCSVDGSRLLIPITGLLTYAKSYTVTIPAGAVKNIDDAATTVSTVFSFSTASGASSNTNISSVTFGSRVIGNAVVDNAAKTIEVNLLHGTVLNTNDTRVAKIQIPDFVFADDGASISGTLPATFENPQEIEVKAEDGTLQTYTVNFTWKAIEPATLPLSIKGSSADDVWLNKQPVGYGSTILNPQGKQSGAGLDWYCAAFSQTGQSLVAHWDGEANLVSFRTRWNSTTANFTFDLEESITGNDDDWTQVERFQQNSTNNIFDVPTSNGILGLRSYAVNPDSRYLRWYFTQRNSTTFYLDDILIENSACDMSLNYSDVIGYTKTNFDISFLDVTVKAAILNNGIVFNGETLNENTQVYLRDGRLLINKAPVDGLNILEIPTAAVKNIKDVCPARATVSGTTIKFNIDAATMSSTRQTVTAIIDVASKKEDVLSNAGTIIKTQYFNFSGMEIKKPTVGEMCIVKYIFDNGTSKAEKFLIK